ncbi:MAG: hypothetical protein QGF67_16515 [Lentisphaeria bacterium]|jgi:hypothetical protein|nr:hypothetical protein [Lentisphaeria bacterium]MDP7743043.1 hypothetical protein [Lentisphaeria bacterium]
MESFSDTESAGMPAAAAIGFAGGAPGANPMPSKAPHATAAKPDA